VNDDGEHIVQDLGALNPQAQLAGRGDSGGAGASGPVGQLLARHGFHGQITPEARASSARRDLEA
jgi:hypothetical protein